MDAEVSKLLKDVDFGPANRATEAIGKLSAIKGVQLSDVEAPLEKALQSAPSGSRLKLYAAYALAALGDNSDLVARAVHEFMQVMPREFHGDDIVNFPWAAGSENRPFHPSVSYMGHRGRQMSPQIASMEAFSYMRGNSLAALSLNSMLKALDKEDWRVMAIYAAGANGDPTLRPALEYLRDRQPGSVESQAAGIALEDFGRSTFLEIADAHARMAPTQGSKRSGCFIATAVYGDPEAPEIEVLREFRDLILARSKFGREFVNVYCWLSPPIASLIQRSARSRTALKRSLIKPCVWAAARILGKRPMQ